MNEQVRGAILAAIAAMLGWLAVTSVSLLVQVSSLQTTSTALKDALDENSAKDHRVEDKLYEEIKSLQARLEHTYGRK